MRPIGGVRGDLRHIEPRCELSVGLIEGAPAADDQEFEITARQTIAKPDAGLDDDLRADAGRIAHRDRQMSVGHYFSYPSGPIPDQIKPFCFSNFAHTSTAPKAPDFETTSTPDQSPPSITDLGMPGSSRPRGLSACAPTAIMLALTVSPPATTRLPGGLIARLNSEIWREKCCAASSREGVPGASSLMKATPLSNACLILSISR